MMESIELLEDPVKNMPMMKKNLKKYEGELVEDALSALFFYKTEQYEKFGLFIGNLLRVATVKEVNITDP